MDGKWIDRYRGWHAAVGVKRACVGQRADDNEVVR